MCIAKNSLASLKKDIWKFVNIDELYCESDTRLPLHLHLHLFIHTRCKPQFGRRSNHDEALRDEGNH